MSEEGHRGKDEAGQRYGRLTVLERAPGRRDHKWLWRCRCDCGAEKVTTGRQLRSGKVSSCGCFRRERQSATATKHGRDRTPEHRTWVAMRQRCTNPRDTSFPYYGGRGIGIAPRWATFAAFFADMGPKPFPEATIDRINPDGDYGPANCRWASRQEQSTNQRRFKEVSS